VKRFLLTAVLVLFAFSAMAAESPIDKGSMIVGGSAYFMTQSGDLYKVGDESPTTIAFMPEFGYFIAPSIMIGAMVHFENYKIGDSKQTFLAFGPMIAYYFNMNPTQIKGAIYPYVKGMFMMGTEKYENGGTEKYSGTQFGGKAGINFMLADHVALDFGVLFTSDSFKQKEPTETESVSGTTIQVGAGIQAFVF